MGALGLSRRERKSRYFQLSTSEECFLRPQQDNGLEARHCQEKKGVPEFPKPPHRSQEPAREDASAEFP